MRQIGFITGIEKEALILKQTANYAKSKIVSTNTKPGDAYTQAKKLAEDGCTILISFGFAGALDPTLAAGDLFLPKSVVDPVGNIFRTDRILLKRVSDHFAKNFSLPASGKIFGSDKIIWKAAEKRQIFDRYGAEAVDMESLGVAQAAKEVNCTFLVVRAITDIANQSLPKKSLESININGRVQISDILWNLVTNVNEFPSFLRLAYNSRKAHVRLRDVARSGFGL
jgi:nucleoside phosphorylase